MKFYTTEMCHGFLTHPLVARELAFPDSLLFSNQWSAGFPCAHVDMGPWQVISDSSALCWQRDSEGRFCLSLEAGCPSVLSAGDAVFFPVTKYLTTVRHVSLELSHLEG